MNIGFSNLYDAIGKVFFERDLAGDNHYLLDESSVDWYTNTDNLIIAQNHPILTPGLLYVSNLFAQAQFEVVSRSTGKPIENHWLIKLLDNPNYYQTRIDLLEATQFMKIARGKAVIYKKIISGFKEPNSLYVLDPKLITYPDNFVSPMSFSDKGTVDNQTVIYDKDGPQETRIKFRDLIYLYDLPNGMIKTNFFDNLSRLDGLKQTLFNTKDSEIAKNIILKSNGKEMISADGTDGYSLDEDEKQDAQNIFNLSHGLSRTRSRSFITTKNVKWKSLHIALRDLGLDESIKVDGNIVYTALHIPKDILSLEAKKTTYNNYRESMTSYIQNDTQSQCNDFVASLQEMLSDNEELKGGYKHLPVMQFLEKEKYEAISLRAKALDDLINAGIPEDESKVLCGFPKNMKLDETARATAQQSSQTTGATEPKTNGQAIGNDIERKIEEVIEQYLN